MITTLASQVAPSSESRRRFGPWPWHLSAANLIGLDLDLVDDIAGDLTEECAAHAQRTPALTRLWCVGQILRSLPHLALGTLRRGNEHARLRLMSTIATLMVAATAGVVAFQMHVGPPARIAADRGFDANDIVINNVDFVQMPIRVIDARGHTVNAVNVHYERIAGDHIDISPSGAIACHERSDATYRATFADLITQLTVHCRPVMQVRTSTTFDFLKGDPPRLIPFEAIDADGAIDREPRGTITIANTKVASFDRGVLTPRRAGASSLVISVGDVYVRAPVIVHDVVPRFDNLTPAQRHAAIPLHISRGDTLWFPVSEGTMWVKWLPRGETIAPPAITAEGPGYCHVGDPSIMRWLPDHEYGAYCYFSAGARIRVARGNEGTPTITGALLLDRISK
ncbi:MAG TPA: hypothetical protein VGM50_03195 [Gemmatimonadaceae bacterium]